MYTNTVSFNNSIRTQFFRKGIFMTIGDHLDNFAGYKVESWEPGQPLKNLENTIYRIAVDYDDKVTWNEKFKQYLAEPNAKDTKGLVLGAYSDEMYDESSEGPINEVIAAKEQLPLLDTLFVNDITGEENEISWIINTDNAPLIHAFPKLKHFGSRGGNGLRLTNLNAPELETLIIESGGLSSEMIKDVATANLPKLKHLELYLGTEDYGYSGSVDDLQPILQDRFKQLIYLGLKNCDDQDDIAKAVVNAPVVTHLETLDLSLGILTDDGAQALLDATTLDNLKHLDLNFNYISEEMAKKIEAFAAAKGFTVDVSSDADYDEEDDDDWRYVSIGE